MSMPFCNVEEPRLLDKGMGAAVGRRTVFRPSDRECMGRVADRVSMGNMGLVPDLSTTAEQVQLRNTIARGGLPTSGRHLQHGDGGQIKRAMELFSNCSTSPTSFALFYLLLNGSGVGRSYDDDMMVVNWNHAPSLRLVLSPDHPDYPHTRQQLFKFGVDFELLPWGLGIDEFTETQQTEVTRFIHKNISTDSTLAANSTLYEVEDSREGWAKGQEYYESMAAEKRWTEELILDFSKVRRCGAPIAGMQNRPASGPLSVMRAFINVRNNVVNVPGMSLWEQAMRVDHYFSVEVQVGGARRAARMSTKNWRDPGIFDFIRIKAENGLWTSNNSVMVDQEFWSLIHVPGHARDVFLMATKYSYLNGEPGFINGDRLESYANGVGRSRPVSEDGRDFGSSRYQSTIGKGLLRDVALRAKLTRFPMTTNPCGEVELHVTGGYCVIADYAPINDCPYDFHNRPAAIMSVEEAKAWDDQVERTVRLGVRFLMRVNQMDGLYSEEVKRTQRIGIGPTGLFEFAWVRFGYTFHDLIDESKSQDFWNLMDRFSEAAKHESIRYARALGVEPPHTVTTIKPAGTTSKLYGLCEGAHLPARRQYLRWVQFMGQQDAVTGEWSLGADPLLAHYQSLGYPVRSLKTYQGMSIVGFPTVPLICRLMPPELVVTASEASPTDQYQWLRLLEKYWIGAERGNQVSYTLKVFTDKYDLESYREIVAKHQPTVKCCSVMPSKPDHEMGYEYLPEQEIDLMEFTTLVNGINDDGLKQDIDVNTLLCASGACPI